MRRNWMLDDGADGRAVRLDWNRQRRRLSLARYAADLEGVVDWQLRMELGLWAAAAGAICWSVLHDRTWHVRHFRMGMRPSA